MADDLIISVNSSKIERYKTLLPQVQSLLETENNAIANMANLAAAIKETFDFLWVGFYLVEKNELVLGPFQGPVACTRIPKGKGVCGKSWEKEKTLVVPNVDKFPGHIACSSLSKSEIVIPLRNKAGEIYGVLDVDSAKINTFDSVDEKYLLKLLNFLVK